MAEGRGYSGSQPASRVECGQWSPQQESPVPMSTYIVVDGSQFCSAELQRGCGHTNGGAGEGDQVRGSDCNSYISASFFSDSVVGSTFISFNKCLFQQLSNRKQNKCAGGGRSVDTFTILHRLS